MKQKIKNIIGSILIGLAWIIKFLHTTILFGLLISICFGILAVTLLGFFDLLGILTADPEVTQIVLGKPIWDIVAVVLGSATMVLGFKKLMDDGSDEVNKLRDERLS